MPIISRRTTGTAHRDRGAAAVEFALLLPLLLLLVFGIIDFGRALNAQITLTQAAREGARLAALGQTGQVTTRVQAAAQPLSGVSVATAACPATPTPTSQTTVTANYTFTFATPLGPIAGLFPGGSGALGGSLAMNGKGVMRCGG